MPTKQSIENVIVKCVALSFNIKWFGEVPVIVVNCKLTSLK